MKKTHAKMMIGVTIPTEYQDEFHIMLSGLRNQIGEAVKKYKPQPIEVHGVNYEGVNLIDETFWDNDGTKKV